MACNAFHDGVTGQAVAGQPRKGDKMDLHGKTMNIQANKRNQKKPRMVRPTRFEEWSYKKRGAVERFFGWIKLGFRKIAPRHERLDLCFEGFVHLASFLIIWRMCEI